MLQTYLEVNGVSRIRVTQGPSACCWGFRCSHFTGRGARHLCPASGTAISGSQERPRDSLRILALQEMEAHQTSLSKKGNSLEKQECCLALRREEGGQQTRDLPSRALSEAGFLPRWNLVASLHPAGGGGACSRCLLDAPASSSHWQCLHLVRASAPTQ